MILSFEHLNCVNIWDSGMTHYDVIEDLIYYTYHQATLITTLHTSLRILYRIYISSKFSKHSEANWYVLCMSALIRKNLYFMN